MIWCWISITSPDLFDTWYTGPTYYVKKLSNVKIVRYHKVLTVEKYMRISKTAWFFIFQLIITLINNFNLNKSPKIVFI